MGLRPHNIPRIIKLRLTSLETIALTLNGIFWPLKSTKSVVNQGKTLRIPNCNFFVYHQNRPQKEFGSFFRSEPCWQSTLGCLLERSWKSGNWIGKGSIQDPIVKEEKGWRGNVQGQGFCDTFVTFYVDTFWLRHLCRHGAMSSMSTRFDYVIYVDTE